MDQLFWPYWAKTQPLAVGHMSCSLLFVITSKDGSTNGVETEGCSFHLRPGDLIEESLITVVSFGHLYRDCSRPAPGATLATVDREERPRLKTKQ